MSDKAKVVIAIIVAIAVVVSFTLLHWAIGPAIASDRCQSAGRH